MLTLPTVEELEKLPMRAVVAYAARTARRVRSELRGIVGDDILEEALRLVETVTTSGQIGRLDSAAVITASERVASAYADASDDMKSPAKFLLVFCFVQAALCAMYVIDAAVDPSNARHQMKSAAEAAKRAVAPIEALDAVASDAARNAARRDYEKLLAEYGAHDEAVIGPPVYCFDDLDQGKGEPGR
jgi:hypothetical protein